MKAKLILKWALILFGATIVWMVFEKLMGWHGPRIADHATYTNLYDLVFLTVFVFAFRDKRSRQPDGILTWKEGLLYGISITAVITLLSPLTQTIIHRLISPEFFPNIINMAVEKQILTQESASARFNLTSYIFQNMIGTFILGTVFTMILALFFGKQRPSATG